MSEYNFEDMLKNLDTGGKLYKEFIHRLERPLIVWSLQRTWGNQVKAAKILGLNRNTFRHKMRKLGIDPKIYK